jgi:hypothetical protein
MSAAAGMSSPTAVPIVHVGGSRPIHSLALALAWIFTPITIAAATSTTSSPARIRVIDRPPMMPRVIPSAAVPRMIITIAIPVAVSVTVAVTGQG